MKLTRKVLIEKTHTLSNLKKKGYYKLLLENVVINTCVICDCCKKETTAIQIFHAQNILLEHITVGLCPKCGDILMNLYSS